MKTLAESLFDDNLVSKDIKFGDLYELEFVHLQSPYCFNKLYTKRLTARYSKWTNEKDIDKYWVYYGHDNNYKTPPSEIAMVCNVIIKKIEDFPMDKVDNQAGRASYSVFIGADDPLSNGLRSYIRDFIYEYVVGLHPHTVYVDSGYKYHGIPGCIQIRIGKNTHKGRYSIPDNIEILFKKK